MQPLTPSPATIVFQNGYNHVGIYVGNGMIDLRSEPEPRGNPAAPRVSWMSVDGYYTAF